MSSDYSFHLYMTVSPPLSLDREVSKTGKSPDLLVWGTRKVQCSVCFIQIPNHLVELLIITIVKFMVKHLWLRTVDSQPVTCVALLVIHWAVFDGMWSTHLAVRPQRKLLMVIGNLSQWAKLLYIVFGVRKHLSNHPKPLTHLESPIMDSKSGSN